MRKKRLASIVLSALLIAAVAVPTAAGRPKVPKVPDIPKGALPVKYPVTVETGGYVNYTWTYDTTEKCSPGYEMTVSEKLNFSSNGARRGQLAIVYGKAFTTPFRGGTWKLDVKLTDWKETNYCEGKPAKIKKPTCHALDGGKIVYAMGPESEGSEAGGKDILAPLVQNTTFVVSPTRPSAQNRSCYANRPDVETVEEEEKDWSVDPTGGIGVPLATESSVFRNKFDVGDTLMKHINISGNCERAVAKASALPTHITSCEIDGHIDVKIKRLG
jgi:hypothetical protein